MYNNKIEKCLCFRSFQVSLLNLESACNECGKRREEKMEVVPAMKHEAGTTAPRRTISQVQTLQSPLPLFNFLEDEVEFVGLVGEGYQAVVLRLRCGKKMYACKIHKYENLAVDIGIYPRPNRSFDKEALAYTKTTKLQGTALPQCHGYIEFTSIPQLEKDQHKDPFEAVGDSLPPYMNFVNGQDILSTSYSQHSPAMLQYFRDAPAGACILRGIIVDEIVDARSLSIPDLRKDTLGDGGLVMLKRIHECGVLHHDLLNLENTLVIPRDEPERVVFIDFSLAEFEEDFRKDPWEEMVKGEVEEWRALFSKEYVDWPLGLGL